MEGEAAGSARVRFGPPDLATLREDGYVAVDMHVHTEHSDGLIRVRDALRLARRTGASFAVTDHNAVSGAVAAVRGAGPGEVIVPGIEISASEGPHLLLYFYTLDDLVDYHEAVISRAVGECPHMATSLPTADVLAGLEGRDAFAVAAHPFGYLFLCRGVCKAIAAGDLAPEVLLRLDGLEGICGGMTRSQNNRAIAFASEHGLALTGGTDAHLLGEIGRVVTAVRAGTVEEFLDAVRRGDAVVWGSEKSVIEKTVQAAAVLPQYASYLRPSLRVHYRQNLPRAVRYLRRRR
ncbi:MAG: PHP domain-containing protein [Methanospirillum sp.]|nr:PHP domain-containing protein [Methanospirillum sp.]